MATLTMALGSCSAPSDESSRTAVPDVVGMEVRDAIAAFDESGYCIGTVWRVDRGEPGVVVGQQPGPQNGTVGPGYLIGLEVVTAPNLQAVLSETAATDCNPELAPAGTVNHAHFYRGAGTD